MKEVILFILLTVYLGLFGTLHSQPAKSSYPFCDTSLSFKYIKSYATDTWKVAKSPTKWKSKQWIYAIGFTGVVVGLVQFDDDIRTFFQKNRSPLTDNLARYVFDPYGYGLYSMPVLEECLYLRDKHD